MVATAESLPDDDEASSTVLVTQSWDVDYLLDEGEDASEKAAKLEQACQAVSSSCTLVSSRRRALRRRGSTLTAVLSRPLSGGNLADQIAEVSQLEARGVDYIALALTLALARTLARSLARTLARNLARTLGRTLGRTLTRTLALALPLTR